MRHRQAGPHEKLDDKVAITDAPHAILSQGHKAEFACEELAINGKRVSGESAAAEGKDGDARDELAQTVEVVFKRERVREQKVGPPDGLTALPTPYQHVRIHTYRCKKGKNTPGDAYTQVTIYPVPCPRARP